MASTAIAGGYRVATQGQKALAMGHTGVAMTDSSEVLFFNPAGLTQLQSDIDIVGGLTLLDGKTKYQNSDVGASAETSSPLGTPVNTYYSNRYSDEFSWGLGLYTPFGTSVEWEKDWEGSHLVNNISLKTIFLQPTAAYQVNETFSIGFGPTYVIGEVELNRNLSTSLADADGNRSNVTIDDSGVTAWGYNLGLMANVNEDLSLGLSYRSEITLEARNGNANFEDIPVALQSTYYDTTFDADLVLPAELTIGMSYKLNSKSTIAFDINRTYWGAYEKLVIEFDLNGVDPSVNLRNYKDVSIYRLGVQHTPNEKWIVRGGIYFDESPVQDGYFAPETPRNDSIGYTTGATYQYSENMAMDFSLLILTFDEIDNSYDYYKEFGVAIPFEGTYASSVVSLGFGISYRY